MSDECWFINSNDFTLYNQVGIWATVGGENNCDFFRKNGRGQFNY